MNAQLPKTFLSLPLDEMEYNIGTCYVTTAAIRACTDSGQDWRDLIRRHASGDFGAVGQLRSIVVTDEEVEGGCWVTDDQAKLNKIALLRGRGQVISVYDPVWVITDSNGDDVETTLMLADEY